MSATLTPYPTSAPDRDAAARAVPATTRPPTSAATATRMAASAR
jgi:hypothetical protein